MSQEAPSLESQALAATLAQVAPSAPTACVGWTARHISAHFAAGSKEIADLIELKVNHHQTRPTRQFGEREASFLAMDDTELNKALAAQGARLLAAASTLTHTAEPTVLFTGRPFTVAQLATHIRSESTLHRWDLVGDDDLSNQLLVQADLTRHAVDLLNTMPVLYEAPEWRARHGGVTDRLRIVLRSPQAADIVYEHTREGATFQIVENGSASGDAVVATDLANRLLAIWGRRSAQRPLTVDTDTVNRATVESVLWGAGLPWAPSGAARSAATR